MIRTRQLTVVLVVLLVASLVGPGPAAADVRGEPDISVYAADATVDPGEETELAVTLLNDGTVFRSAPGERELESAVTTARGVRVLMRSGEAPITVETGTQAVGTLPEGSSAPIPFRIVVDEEAEPGTYTVPVEVRYSYTSFIGTDQGPGVSGRSFEEGEWRRLSITLTVEERARFEVVDVQPSVSVGGNGSVAVSLRNRGTETARNALLTVESANSDLAFGSSPAASSFVGSWEPGETHTVSFRTTVAPEAVRRSYAVTASVQYEDENGINRTAAPVSFGITPGREQTFAVEAVESGLRIGEEGTLRGELVNTGDAPVRDALLRLETNSSVVTPVETEFAIGDLAPGERVPFSFEVELDEDTVSGPRQFTYRVQYRDGGSDRMVSDPIDVRVSVPPDRSAFDVELVTEGLEAGGNGPLAVAVTNDGTEPYTDVSAKLFADAPLSTVDSEAFVDRLDPGETAVLTFVVGVDGTAIPKDYPASIDFQYDDAGGDTRLSDTYRVPVTVVEPEGDGGVVAWITGRVPAWLVGVGSALTLGLVVVVWLRRRE